LKVINRQDFETPENAYETSHLLAVKLIVQLSQKKISANGRSYNVYN